VPDAEAVGDIAQRADGFGLEAAATEDVDIP